MHNMVLVNLVTREGKTIPVGMAESFEDAEKLIDYADRLIGMKKIGEFQTLSFPEYGEDL